MSDLIEFLRARLDDDRLRPDALRTMAANLPPVPAGKLNELADRMLVEVEAKRDIVDLCERYAQDGSTSGADLAKQVLRLLGLPYAGHPDYRQERRP